MVSCRTGEHHDAATRRQHDPLGRGHRREHPIGQPGPRLTIDRWFQLLVLRRNGLSHETIVEAEAADREKSALRLPADTRGLTPCNLYGVWLDDDGDEPIGGEIPDPSTRHWRHPSEIAAEAAREAAAAGPIIPEGATAGVVTSAHGSSSTSILWPISVVGGCVAIAALGVVGLYLTGAAEVDEQQVASATTVSPSGSGLSSLALPQPSSPDNRVRTDESDGNPADAERLFGLETDQQPLSTTTTTLAPSSTTSTTVPASTTTVPAKKSLAAISAPVGPAIYPTSGGGSEPMASLILADGYLLTSASAMAGRTEVALLSGDTWADALVSHVDLISDVAVLTMLDPTIELAIPDSLLGAAAKTGISVFLGYCPSDMLPPPNLDEVKPNPDDAAEWDPTAAEAGCHPMLESIVGPPDGDELPADGEAAAAGGPDETAPSTVPEADPPSLERQLETPPETIPAPVQKDRTGKVYSLDQTLRTLAGRLLYEPIRTGIPQESMVAGSPLRDRTGHTVGLVVADASPNVSAVPIDRAVAVAKSMVEIGLASPAWIGIDVLSTSSGVEVVEVDADGPANGKLQIGDLIDRVNGDVVIEADYLEHLTREAGPEKALVVRFIRDGERRQAAIRITTAPLDE